MCIRDSAPTGLRKWRAVALVGILGGERAVEGRGHGKSCQRSLQYLIERLFPMLAVLERTMGAALSLGNVSSVVYVVSINTRLTVNATSF